jgi:CBS domain-containing protein
MYQLDLPVIAPDASVANAIQLMTQNACSAVVVALAAKPRVVDIDMVLHAHRSGGHLKIGRVVPREVTIALGAKFSADKVMADQKAQGTVLNLMDDARAIYALTAMGRRRAVILTRHEGFANMLLKATMLYRCKADGDHVWTAAELWQPGNKCRNDLSATELVKV